MAIWHLHHGHEPNDEIRATRVRQGDAQRGELKAIFHARRDGRES